MNRIKPCPADRRSWRTPTLLSSFSPKARKRLFQQTFEMLRHRIMKKILPFSFALAVLLTHAAFGQQVATVPAGVINITIAGGSVGTPKITSFCMPLKSPVGAGFVGQSAGLITGVTASTISNSAAGWTAGSLSQAASPYFLRIKSGQAAGYVFQVSTSAANTSTTATLLPLGIDLTSLGIVAGTDRYELVPGDTLKSIFGTGGNGGNGTVLGATTQANSDVVRVSVGGVWLDYYFHTGANQWRQGTLPVNRDNIAIHPNAGIIYTRKAASNILLPVFGTVPDVGTKTLVGNTGPSVIANNFPVDRAIGSFGIQNIAGFVKANPPSIPITSADTVSVWTGLTWSTYHYNSALSQWREGSLPVNRSTIVIPAGRPILIQKKSISTGTAIFPETMPYSL